MACLYWAGELSTFDSYLHPLEGKSQFGLAYSYYDKEYKFYMTNDIMRPQVLALGSSRILQVKSDLIKPNISFYNAGGAVQNIYDFRLFLEKLTYKPDVIIANFDQFYFNANYDNQVSTFSEKTYEKPEYSFSNSLNSCATFYEDLLADKINVREIFNSDNIGISAICKHAGFTTDGSYYDGWIEKSPDKSLDYNFKDTQKRIKNKNLRFEKCDHANMNVLNEVDSLLKFCDSRGIILVGFLPPFAPKINRVMEDDGNYNYLKEIPELLNTVFLQHHAVLMDFTKYENQYSKDCYFLDGFHGSEIVYNAIIADILDSVPQIRKYFIPSDSIRQGINLHLHQHIKYHNL
jgi:hypothetical protein